MATVGEGRYDRQMRVTGVGAAGQEALRRSRVLVVGLGGLGCPAATALVGAGVGTVGLCDDDRVALSNLHRQALYAAADVGERKVDIALRRLAALDPDATLLAYPDAVTADNAHARVESYDVVLDCTDSLAARYALSDACARLGKTLVQAGLGGLDGQLTQLCGPDAPCYRCLHPRAEEGPTCADEGTLGPLANAMGNLQAFWALQTLLGWPQAVPGRTLLLDGRTGATRTVSLKRRKGCEAHVSQPSANGPASNPPAKEDGPACPMPWNAPDTLDIPVHEFAPRSKDFFVLDVREPDEFEEGHIPGATLVPLGQLPRRLNEVPKDRQVVCVCAVGGRSARATDFLRSQGYNALNLRGGMRAWMLARHV